MNDGFKINVYCENARIIAFLRYVLSEKFHSDFQYHTNFIDLEQENCVQLARTGIYELKNDLIVLSSGVLEMRTCKEQERGNFIFLPFEIEKEVFVLLKDHRVFLQFQKNLRMSYFTYDVCFNNWPLDAVRYNADECKFWYDYAKDVVGNEALFDVLYSEHQDIISAFIKQFVGTLNWLAKCDSVS